MAGDRHPRVLLGMGPHSQFPNAGRLKLRGPLMGFTRPFPSYRDDQMHRHPSSPGFCPSPGFPYPARDFHTQPRISIPSPISARPGILAQEFPRAVTEGCRTCTDTGRAVSAPPRFCRILLGAATNPLSLRHQVEQPDVSHCIQTASPQNSASSASCRPWPRAQWELLPQMGLASPTPGYQHLDSCSQMPKLLQVQQNYLPGAAALGFFPFPIPTQLNTAGRI